MKKWGDLLPYGIAPVGFEAMYTGQTAPSTESDEYRDCKVDAEGTPYVLYSLWGFAHTKEENWNDEIRLLNSMQQELPQLSDDVRRIRQQIASLVCCDSGVPVTIDEILNAIGTGSLPARPFHAGCWMSLGGRSTQPEHTQSMRTIDAIIRGHVDGIPKHDLLLRFPQARGFIERTFAWLGRPQDLSAVQRLMIERMLLPFEFFTRRNENRQEVFDNCFASDRRGEELDQRLSEAADLPKIFPNYRQEFRDNLARISDPQKRTLYQICGHIANCVSELSDCHHNTFRFIERWLHAIGTLEWTIPTRKEGAEGQRLGRLLFGYSLGLDRWLQEVPQQFLLLDLGHVDLGFDPRNEVIRVYAYLGEDRSATTRWLAGCLWYTLTLEPPASLYRWGWRHKDLLAQAQEAAISVCEWMDRKLGR